MRALRLIALAAFALAAGCTPGYTVPTSGGSGAFTVTANGATVSSVAIVGSGSSSAITVSEKGYTGTFTATSSNTAVVTVASGPSAGAVHRDDTSGSATSSGAFTLTAVGGGTSTISFTDSFGNTASLSVGVTTTTGVVYGKGP